LATILVVDDKALNRSLLTTLLGYQGHRVIEASSGSEAISLTMTENPELIITDILMPNMDGYELVRNLRALGPSKQSQIVFYSATYLEGEARALAHACGVSHVICKPAEPELILKTIEKALALGRPTSARPAQEAALQSAAIRVLNDKLYRKVIEVEELNDALERRVAERTLALEEANSSLKKEILERQKAEEAAVQSREAQLRSKGEFLSHVSHELRSPLSVVHQFTTILLDALAGDLNTDQREYLEIIFRNVNQLKHMIDDLVEASRAETSKLTVRRSSISVAEVIAQVLQSLAETSKINGITLKFECQEDLPPVHADPGRINQVLANLLDNALKFSPPDTTVTVRAEVFADDRTFVLLSITDCGCGIGQGHAERVFDRLYQVEGEFQSSRKGLGLGLYICKELIGLHGGAIWINSKNKGIAGTTMHFTLPVFTIQNMITPVVIKDGKVAASLVLLTIKLSPATPWKLERDRVGAVQKVQQVLEGCMLADLDVILPMQSGLTSDYISIVARTDQHGAEVMQTRFREQLSRIQWPMVAEVKFTIKSEVIDLEKLDEKPLPEQSVANLASTLKKRLKDVVTKGDGLYDREEDIAR
jgi:signal transduction histidine kinase